MTRGVGVLGGEGAKLLPLHAADVRRLVVVHVAGEQEAVLGSAPHFGPPVRHVEYQTLGFGLVGQLETSRPSTSQPTAKPAAYGEKHQMQNAILPQSPPFVIPAHFVRSQMAGG